MRYKAWGCMGAAALRPALGRFVQPDTVVPEPGDVQGLNRFAYVRNNPLRYTDPMGHAYEGGTNPDDPYDPPDDEWTYLYDPDNVPITAEAIYSWGYDEQVTAILLRLYASAMYWGKGSESWKILDYWRDHRPGVDWREVRYCGFTSATFGGYHISLNPNILSNPDWALGVVAHESAHAMANFGFFDSDEQEYRCDQRAGRVYEEVLRSAGTSPDEAIEKAQSTYEALTMDLREWVETHDAPGPFHYEWQAQIPYFLGPPFLPFAPLGAARLLLGHPPWDQH